MGKYVLDWSTTAMYVVEAGGQGFLQGDPNLTCSAMTTGGPCQDPAGYSRISGHELVTVLCVFHNLWNRRDPLGRYETK